VQTAGSRISDKKTRYADRGMVAFRYEVGRKVRGGKFGHGKMGDLVGETQVPCTGKAFPRTRQAGPYVERERAVAGEGERPEKI